MENPQVQALHLDGDIAGVSNYMKSVQTHGSHFLEHEQLKSPNFGPLTDHKASEFVDHNNVTGFCQSAVRD